MDILAYDYLLEGAKKFNEKNGKPYGNVVVATRTTNTTYPHTVIEEIRNVANPAFNTPFDRVSSNGYSVRIYAKNKGKFTKQFIARSIAQTMDYYLSNCGLTRISFNANESVNDNSIYEIIMTYSGNLHENRRKFV
jgi:hypothetical protein